MELLDKYKLELCEEVKKYIPYKYGQTSTVFIDKNHKFVIKEIYIEGHYLESKKIKEIVDNIRIMEDRQLRNFSVPFIGFDICDEKLMLKFKYMGETLQELMYDKNVNVSDKEYESIKMKVFKINKLFAQKKIYHNDLHPGNIFYINKKIYLADWGRNIIRPIKKVREDYDKIFNGNYYLSKYIKNYGMEELKAYLITSGLDKVIEENVEKETAYQLEKFPFKPKSFMKKIRPLFYHQYLLSALHNNPYIIQKVKDLEGL